jgi:hypothetical protein
MSFRGVSPLFISILTADLLFWFCTIDVVKYVPGWFPGAGFKAFAAEARKLGQDLVQLPFEDLKSRMVRLLHIDFVNGCKRFQLIPRRASSERRNCPDIVCHQCVGRYL